jgi:hypothetical protein
MVVLLYDSVLFANVLIRALDVKGDYVVLLR